MIGNIPFRLIKKCNILDSCRMVWATSKHVIKLLILKIIKDSLCLSEQPSHILRKCSVLVVISTVQSYQNTHISEKSHLFNRWSCYGNSGSAKSLWFSLTFVLQYLARGDQKPNCLFIVFKSSKHEIVRVLFQKFDHHFIRNYSDRLQL